MTRKMNILAVALVAATLGLAASSNTADAAVAGLGASTAKTTVAATSAPVEQVKGGRGGGFRGGFRGGFKKHWGGHRFVGHRHHWKKHRYVRHYGYYGVYSGSDCYWVKKWYHGYAKKFWVCH